MTSDIALFETDEFGLVLWANDRACSLVGRPKFLVFGYFIFSWLTPESALTATPEWDQSVGNGRSLKCVVELLTPEGVTVSANLCAEVSAERTQSNKSIIVYLEETIAQQRDGVRVELAVTNQAVSELLKKQDALTMAFNDSQRKARSLEFEVYRLRNWIPTQDSHFVEHDRELKLKDQHIARLEKSLALVNEKSKKTVEQAQRLDSELEDKSSQLAVAEIVLSRKTMEFDGYSIRMAALAADVTNLEKLVGEKNGRIRQLEIELNERQRSDKLPAEISAERDAVQAGRGHLEGELLLLRKENTGQSNQITDLKKQLEHSGALGKRTSQLLGKQLISVHEQLVDFENNSSLLDQLQVSEKKVEELEQALAVKSIEFGRVLRARDESKLELQNATQESEVLKRHIARLEADVQNRIRHLFAEENSQKKIDQSPVSATRSENTTNSSRQSRLELEKFVTVSGSSAHLSQFASQVRPFEEPGVAIFRSAIAPVQEYRADAAFTVAVSAHTVVTGPSPELIGQIDEYFVELPEELRTPTVIGELELRPKVLLVEDNAANQREIGTLMRILKIDVVLAQNGKQALELINTQKFDFILMDGNMPVMDGYECSKAIRVLEKKLSLHTPIIAMLIYVDSMEMQRCRECGMDDAIAKPIQLNVIEALKSCYWQSHPAVDA